MRNPVYEQALNKQGVEWEYLERLELSSVDRTKSLANQARLEQALDPDLVAHYREAYKQGDQFPPLVVHRPGRGKFILLDGNQRYSSCQPFPGWKGVLFHDAYLIKSDEEEVLNRIAWSFNNLVNGRRLSYEESLSHAVTFVRKYNWTRQQAATEFGVPHRAVEKIVALEEMKDRLREQKVKKIPVDYIIERLAPLANLGDDVFAKAAETAANIGAASTDVDELMKKVKRAKTHAAKLATITEYESSDHAQKRKAQTKGGTIQPRTPDLAERLARALRTVRSLLEESKVKTVFLPHPKAEREEAEELATDVIRLLAWLHGPQVVALAQQDKRKEEIA